VYGAPSVAEDGTVYVGSDSKNLYAFKPNGDTVFKLKLDGEVDTPLLLRPQGGVVAASERELLGVSARGDVLFRYEAAGKIFTSAARDSHGTLYFGAHDHCAYAVSEAGALRWKMDLGSDVDAGPAVADDGTIVFGTDAGEVVRVSPDGRILARTDVRGFVRGAISLARNGDALVGVYGPVPAMVRISAEGQVVGRFPVPGTGAKEFGVHGGALEDATGAVYFGAQDNRVYGLDPAGNLRFTLETQGDVDAPLTLMPNGDLVFASEDGNVYCAVNSSK
jgi:outer membrane protein assembly factor BamB